MKNKIFQITMLVALMINSSSSQADEISFDSNIITEQPFVQSDFDNVSQNLSGANLNDLQNNINVTVSDNTLNNAVNQSDNNVVNNINTANLSESQNQLIAQEINESSDDDECAIWLCLPNKFPEGCANAHKRFHKRIARHQSPLPPFSSCIKEVKNMMISGMSGSVMSYDNNNAAYIPKHRKTTCIKYADNYGQYANSQGNCLEYKVEDIPESYVKGSQCIHDSYGHTHPTGCIETRSYIDIKMDGNQFGDTYFY